MFSETGYFLRLSIRYFSKKQLHFTLVNIIGLAVGFACFLSAVLFSYDELNYDRFHPNSDRIFRLVVDWNGDGVERKWARSSIPVGRVGDGAIPEIDQLVRIRKNPGNELLSVNDKDFYESLLLFAEPEFFQLFGFTLLRGNPNSVLNDKYGIVLTERTAKKYFGDQDPLGKTIRYDGRFDLKVTGIAQNPPSHSHIQFGTLLPFLLLEEIFSEKRRNHWGQFDHYTYLKTTEEVAPSMIEEKMASFLSDQAPDWVGEKVTLKLQPIRSIHLQSQRQGELSMNSDMSYSVIFLIASGLILVLTLINYINLLMATYLARYKEIAMRKILGSSKSKLLIGLMSESILFALTGMLLAIIMMQILIPSASALTGKHFQGILNFRSVALFFGLSLVTGVICGVFPAIRLIKISSFNKEIKLQKSSIYQSLTLLQLVISALLLTAVLGVTRQLNFMQETSLGYSGEDIFVIPLKSRSENVNYKTTVNRLTNIPGIQKASFSSSTPGTNNYLTYTYGIETANREEAALSTIILDEYFYSLYDIELKQGRLPDGLAQKETEVVINEAAVDFFNLQDPIGKSVNGKVKGTIVGVVDNFQINSLHAPLEPVIMYNFLPTLRYVSIKLERSDSFQRTLEQLGTLWSEIYPQYPLEFHMLEEDNQRLYSFERSVLYTLNTLVVIAIFITAFGLISHTALYSRQSARELSIRKVLGGSFYSILYHALKKLTPLLFLAIIFVITFGYWGLNSWLQYFALRNPPDLFTFFVPILSMALLTFFLIGIILWNQLNQASVKYLRDQ